MRDINSGAELPWQKICQKLNIDGFVTGNVKEYGKIYAVLYSQTAVSLGVQFRSCRNAGFIWQKDVTETKRDGDIPLSLTGLAAAMLSTYMRHQDITALEVAAKLSMKLTLDIPNPSSLRAVPPEIKFFLHNASGRLLVPGEMLKVVMRGAPGAQGYWTIPGVVSRLPLEEKEPGIYIGQYKVRSDDRALDAQLMGYLVSAEKAESRWMDILSPVTLGKPTVLPSVISSNTTLTAQSSPYLISEFVLVKKNVSLQIQPGTLIWSNGAGLVVNGQLDAMGEVENRIRFRSLSDSPWKGITLSNSSASRLNYVAIKNAKVALNVRRSPVSATGLILEENSWGVVAQESDIEIENSQIRYSQNAGVSCRDGRITLRSNYITDNETGGAQFENSQVSANNNAIFNNGKWDIKNLDADTTLELGNNWWGTSNPAEVKVLGGVSLLPLLSSSPGL